MDKYEFKLSLNEINKLIQERRFGEAADIADTIDWNHVKSSATLGRVGEVYKIVGDYERSRDVMEIAYRREQDDPTDRRSSVVYSLCELSFQLFASGNLQNDYVRGLQLLQEYQELEPENPKRLILQYRMLDVSHVSAGEKITVLEQLQKETPKKKSIARWEYELAGLYAQSGDGIRAAALCTEVMGFGGKYGAEAEKLLERIRLDQQTDAGAPAVDLNAVREVIEERQENQAAASPAGAPAAASGSPAQAVTAEYAAAPENRQEGVIPASAAPSAYGETEYGETGASSAYGEAQQAGAAAPSAYSEPEQTGTETSYAYGAAGRTETAAPVTYGGAEPAGDAGRVSYGRGPADPKESPGGEDTPSQGPAPSGAVKSESASSAPADSAQAGTVTDTETSISEVMAEWERIRADIRRANEEKRAQRILEDTGNILQNFDETARHGLLEDIEKGAARQRRNARSSRYGGAAQTGSERDYGTRREEEGGYDSEGVRRVRRTEEDGYDSEGVRRVRRTEEDGYDGEGVRRVRRGDDGIRRVRRGQEDEYDDEGVRRVRPADDRRRGNSGASDDTGYVRRTTAGRRTSLRYANPEPRYPEPEYPAQEEAQPEDTEVPAQESLPEFDEIPVRKEEPAYGEPPAQEQEPEYEPEYEEIPAKEPAPEFGDASVQESGPEYEETPSQEDEPEYEEAPAGEPSPEYGEASAEQPSYFEPEYEEVPAEEPEPEYEEAPAEEPGPEYEEVPVQEPSPEYAEVPAAEPGAGAPRRSDIPVSNEDDDTRVYRMESADAATRRWNAEEVHRAVIRTEKERAAAQKAGAAARAAVQEEPVPPYVPGRAMAAVRSKEQEIEDAFYDELDEETPEAEGYPESAEPSGKPDRVTDSAAEPEYDEPEYDEPGDEEPVREEVPAAEPEYEEPEYGEAPAQEPESKGLSAAEPEYDEPEYDEPGDEEPVREEIPAAEPEYGEPEDDEPAYDEPGEEESPAQEPLYDGAQEDVPAREAGGTLKQDGEKPARAGARGDAAAPDRETESASAQDQSAPASAAAPKGKRELTREERRLFGPFCRMQDNVDQLTEALEQISLSSATGNLLILGNEATADRVARGILDILRRSDPNFVGKIAKATGASLNRLDPKGFSKTFGKLENGALIVTRASDIAPKTMDRLYQELEGHEHGLVLILTDGNKKMEQFRRDNEKYLGSFTAVISIKPLDDKALVAYARDYALSQDYSIDEFGQLALAQRISSMQTQTHHVTLKEVRDLVDEAISYASKKNVGTLMEIVTRKRYDEDDRIILHEKDFTHY